MNTAQPTISKRLQELEAACGFGIFEKHGRELYLIVCPSFTYKAEISSLLAQEVKFAIVGSPRDFSSNKQYRGHELSTRRFLTHGSVGAIGAVDKWIADVDWNPNQTVQVDSLVAQIEMARAA